MTRRIVSDAFDTIIGLESGKIIPSGGFSKSIRIASAGAMYHIVLTRIDKE